jgi:hypothetical protein
MLLFMDRFPPCCSGGKLVTHMSGAVSDSVGKPLEGEKMGVVDPEARALVLHLYGGLIKVGVMVVVV